LLFSNFLRKWVFIKEKGCNKYSEKEKKEKGGPYLKLQKNKVERLQ
jgi:hypothetical protein